jgi:hypothetical protein
MIARGNEDFEPSERTAHDRRPGGSLLAIETGPDFQIVVSGSQIRLYMESKRHAPSASRLKNAR